MSLFRRFFILISLVFAPNFLSCEEPSCHHVLFLMGPLVVGGAEQSFISLMNGWKIPNTKVDILLEKPGGDLEQFLRKDFSLVSATEAFSRSYDAAVCFMGWWNPNEGILRVQAQRKIQWIHTDLRAYPGDVYFKHPAECGRIDAFVCVSEKAAEGARSFPHLRDKIFIVRNVLDGKLVKRKSLELTNCFPSDGISNVVSVGRLAYEKGFDRAIRVHSRLDKEGINFRWYAVGDGPERPKLEQKIQRLGLQKKFILLGQKTNPYPFIAQADIFAQPSRYEGCSVAVNEAKILGRPILFTDVAGAREQIESEKTGLIVANNEGAIYNGLKRLLQDKKLRHMFSRNLQDFVYENDSIYSQIEKILFGP